MSGYAEVVIGPKDLLNKTIYHTKVVLEKSCDILLSGTVYDEQCRPVEGAVVEVVAVYNPNYEVKKGYVITNQEGEFAIVVAKNDYVDYILNIYTPLIND